ERHDRLAAARAVEHMFDSMPEWAVPQPPRSRPGPTLEERSRGTGTPHPRTGRDVVPRAAARHCWVTSAELPTASWPGLLVEWRRESAGDWWGRVAYVVEDDGAAVLVESWLP